MRHVSLPMLGNGPPPAPEAAPEDGLYDAHGRRIRDVRISITDRCNFRCVYCLEPDSTFLPPSKLLQASEIVRLGRIVTGLGVRHIRLTGGEPTVRADLVEIIEGLRATGVDDLAMTTNGSVVTPERARAWRDAGLNRLTVSLDSLREDRFRAITRSTTGVSRVLEAIRVAKDTGFDPVRVNAVIVRGRNDDEIRDFASLARDLDIDVRLIEFMPLDDARAWDRSSLVTADEMLRELGDEVVPIRRERPSATALPFRFRDSSRGSIGIIASVTRQFCGACSRLRITADGQVRPCLFSRTEYDVTSRLRAGADDRAIASFLRDVVWTKDAGHRINDASFVQPDRTMSAIGG